MSDIELKHIKFKTILVGLDLTEMDKILMIYTPTLLKAFPVERLLFVHIAKKQELPEAILKEYPDLNSPLSESITSKIRSKLEPVLGGLNVNIEVIVEEGSPLESILRITKKQKVDLIVMGRKLRLKGSGLLAGHVVRKSPISMLFVTEGSSLTINKILLPADFSDYSALSLKLALDIQQRIGATFHFLNIYEVPMGYSKTGKSYEDFAEIMESHARKEYERFCRRYNLDRVHKCEFKLESEGSVPSLIYDHADRSGSDLILIGSRGRTQTSALLIGSIVERLVNVAPEVPVLVVKKKGESMGFFEALMNI